MRLPTPYRPEADIVAAPPRRPGGRARLGRRRRTSPAPGCRRCATSPPPFWAMESLLREYPISSAEGLALMRLAEALLRVPDAETAIALTADQLGRADFDGAADGARWSRLSPRAIALSKKLPARRRTTPPGLLTRLGARTVVAATLRAVQLLGRQFVLGQTIGEAMARGATRRSGKRAVCASATTCWAKARAPTPTRCATSTATVNAIAVDRGAARRGAGSPERNDGISIKLSALHPRYEDAQRERVMRELVPRVWQLCELAARRQHQPHHRRRRESTGSSSRSTCSRRWPRSVAREHPQWQRLRPGGAGLPDARAGAGRRTSPRIARKLPAALHVRLVKGAYWDAEIKRAQELGLPHYPVFTHKHHTDISLPGLRARAAGRARRDLPAVRDAQRRHHRGDPADGARARRAVRAAAPARHGRGRLPRGAEEHRRAGARLRAGRPAPRPARLPGAPAAGERRQLLLRAPAGRRRRSAWTSCWSRRCGSSAAPSLPLPPALYGRAGAPQQQRPRPRVVERCARRCWPRTRRATVPAVPTFDAARAADAVDGARCGRLRALERARRSRERAAVLRRAADALRGASCRASARCWSRRPSRPGATRSPKCARRSTSCATTPTRPSASCAPSRCPARPARATSCA